MKSLKRMNRSHCLSPLMKKRTMSINWNLNMVPQNLFQLPISELWTIWIDQNFIVKTTQKLSNQGFNVNYAPSVNMAINPNNPLIIKKWKKLFKRLQKLIQNIRQLKSKGTSSWCGYCTENFSGHGYSQVYSHLGIENVSSSRKKGLVPYFDLIKIGSVQAIMNGQIINQNLDKDLLPTTLNKQTITYLLRKKLGYEGFI